MSSYDWSKDPNNYKIMDEKGLKHIPPNRCFKCGLRFVGSQGYAAFCNICDSIMKKGGEEILLNYNPSAIQARIRIPDDIETEDEYRKKLDVLDISVMGSGDIVLKAQFLTAKELV